LMPDLYHVTLKRSVDSIFREGLRVGATLRAKQKADSFVEDEDPDPMVPDPPEAVADRMAEEMIGEARYEVGVPDDWPHHERAVFFWPDESKAQKVASGEYHDDPIVAVDSNKLPDGATSLIAPTGPLDNVFKRLYDHAADRNHLARDERGNLVRDLEDWWRQVEEYTGQALYDHEVFCGADIPPTAIEWIHDPGENRRLYEPPDDPQQQRFIDLFPGVGQ